MGAITLMENLARQCTDEGACELAILPCQRYAERMLTRLGNHPNGGRAQGSLSECKAAQFHQRRAEQFNWGEAWCLHFPRQQFKRSALIAAICLAERKPIQHLARRVGSLIRKHLWSSGYDVSLTR